MKIESKIIHNAKSDRAENFQHFYTFSLAVGREIGTPLGGKIQIINCITSSYLSQC